MTQRKEAVMKLSVIVVAAVVSLFLVVSSWADNTTPASRSGGQEKLGRVLFKTSCSPEAQKQFERALAMLHSFFFPETIKAFSAIPEADPNCAIAYWGIAISQRPNPLVGPFDAATLKRGLDAIEKGRDDRRQDRARARLVGRPQGVLQELRHRRPGHAHAELREGHGGAGQEVSR